MREKHHIVQLEQARIDGRFPLVDIQTGRAQMAAIVDEELAPTKVYSAGLKLL